MINQDYLQNYLFSNVIQMSCLTLEVCSKKKVRTKGRLRSLSFQLIGHCTKRKKLMMMITSVDMVMIISFYYIFYLTLRTKKNWLDNAQSIFFIPQPRNWADSCLVLLYLNIELLLMFPHLFCQWLTVYHAKWIQSLCIP